jgi:hypothetical protein
MGKQLPQSSGKTNDVFDDLDKLLDFCCRFGYRFNEVDLYNFKSYAWQQYSKFTQGKNARDMWLEDGRRLNRTI